MVGVVQSITNASFGVSLWLDYETYMTVCKENATATF